jgi:phage-related protein
MKTADEIANDLLGKIRGLGSALQDRVLEAFQMLEPLLNRVVSKVTEMVRSLTDEDMANMMETVVGGLLVGAETFYNLIVGAINSISALINSDQLRKLGQLGETLMKAVVGPSAQDQKTELQGRANHLYGEIKKLEEERAAAKADDSLTGQASELLLGSGKDSYLDSLKKELAEIEKVLDNLEKKTGKAFKAPKLAEALGLSTNWKEDLMADIRTHMGKRAKQKGMNVEDASNKAPDQVNVDYGDESGLELDRSKTAKQRAKEKLGDLGGEDGIQVPKHLEAMIPNLEHFQSLAEDTQKTILEAMQTSLELTEMQNFQAGQAAGAAALMAESGRIQAEQLIKPALMQQALTENLERIGEIYKDSEDNVETLVELQKVRVDLENQFGAAVKAGQGDHARNLDQQLKMVEGALAGSQKMVLSESQAAILTQNRVSQMETLMNLMEDINAINADDGKNADQNYLKIAEASAALADLESKEQGTITAERRAQLDAIWKALGHTEQMVVEAEKAAQINIGEQWGKDIKASLGILGDMMDNPAGFQELGSDLAQGAKDAYKAFNDAPEGEGVGAAGAAISGAMEAKAGGPKAMAANAIMKLIQRLEVFGESLELTLGNSIKMLNAIFSPITNALKEINKALEPVWQALGELSQVIFDAFTPIKPLVAVIKGFAKIFTSVFKGLASGLKPLTHAMDQLTRIIESIFGGFGGGSFGRNIEDLESALETVRDALADMRFGDMNPADAVTKLNDATKEYEELRKKAFSDGASEEDISKFTEFANTYLGLSQEVNKSSSQYVKDFEKVKKDLTGLEGKLVNAIDGADELDGIGSFIDQLLKGLFGFVEKIAEAIVAAVGKLLEGAINLLAYIAKAIIDKVKEALQGAWDLLTQIAQAIWDAVVKALQGVWNLLTQLAQAVWDVIVQALQGAWNLLTKLAQLVWDVIVQAFEGTYNALKPLWDKIWGVVEAGFTGVYDALKALWDIIWGVVERTLGGAYDALKALWDKIWGVVEDGFGGAYDALKALWDKIWAVVEAGLTGYHNALTELWRIIWNVIQEGLKGTVNLLQPLLDVVKDVFERGFSGTVNFLGELLKQVAGALERGFGGAVDFLGELFQQIVKALQNGFDQAFNFVDALTKEVVKALQKGFDQAWDFTVQLITEVGKALASGFNQAWNFVELLMTELGKALTAGFDQVWNFTKELLKAVGKALAEGFDQAWNFLVDLTKEVVAALARGFGGAVDFLSNLLSEVVGALQRGFQGTKNFLTQLWNEVVAALQRGFQGTVDFLGRLISEGLNAITRGFQGPIDFIGTLFSQGVAAITRALSGPVSFLQTMITGVTDFIQKGLSGVFDFSQMVIDKIGSMLQGGKNLLQLILDKIMTALGLKGNSGKFPILPNPLKFLGGPDNFLELSYSFGKGGSTGIMDGSYTDGGMAKGPSHQGGIMGVTKSGAPFLFEGGEFILNKKASQAIGPELLGQLNRIQSRNETDVFLKNMGIMADGGFPDANKPIKSDKWKHDFGGPQDGHFRFQTGGNADGYLDLLHLNNPLSDFSGPEYWYARMKADLAQGDLRFEQNLIPTDLFQYGAGGLVGGGRLPEFGFGGSLGGIIDRVKDVVDNTVGRGGAGGVVHKALDPVQKLLRQLAGFDRPKSGGFTEHGPDTRTQQEKEGYGHWGIPWEPGVPKGGTLNDPGKTKFPDYTSGHSFTKGMEIGFKGGLGDHDWFYDLIKLDNPFFEWVEGITGYVDKSVKTIIGYLPWPLNSVAEWGYKTISDPVYGLVRDMVGPEDLKLGIKGKMLDFWNSKLSANFGGDVLDQVGLNSLPLPKSIAGDFSKYGMGGLVNGLPHNAGGTKAELEGGEFVINKQATQSLGVNTLESLNAHGGAIFDRQSDLLTRIEKAILSRSGGSGEQPEIIVNVYTDMKGEAQAAVNSFRTEIKQRAARIPTGSTKETYLPVSVL